MNKERCRQHFEFPAPFIVNNPTLFPHDGLVRLTSQTPSKMIIPPNKPVRVIFSLSRRKEKTTVITGSIYKEGSYLSDR
jgi:hypothetical protein